MSATSERGASSSRGRSSTASRSASRSASSRSGNSSSRGRNGSARSGSATGSRARSQRSQNGQSQRENGQSQRKNGGEQRAASSRNGGDRSAQNSGGLRETITTIGVPIVSGVVGVAGGVLLGRTALQRNRKVLGITMPTKVDLSGVGQQLSEAGRQFGKLAGEVRSVREKAEQVGRVLS